MQSKAVTLVAQSTAWEINDYQLVARQPVDRLRQAGGAGRCRGSTCFRWPTRKSWPVTDEWFVSREPVFSADGKYCCSSRTAIITPADTTSRRRRRGRFPLRRGRIYFVTLAKDTDVAGGPEERRSAGAKARAAEKKAEGAKRASGARPRPGREEGVVKVDLDGLPERIGALPLPPSNYGRPELRGRAALLLPSGHRRQAGGCWSTISMHAKDADVGAV